MLQSKSDSRRDVTAMEDKYKNYVLDLGVILKEMSMDASKEYQESKNTNEESYKLGYLMGFHRVLTLMQQQAEGFCISQKEIGLEGFDADTDL